MLQRAGLRTPWLAHRSAHRRDAPPAHLRRIDNPIFVPAEQRACPSGGAERARIGHEVTEIIDPSRGDRAPRTYRGSLRINRARDSSCVRRSVARSSETANSDSPSSRHYSSTNTSMVCRCIASAIGTDASVSTSRCRRSPIR